MSESKAEVKEVILDTIDTQRVIGFSDAVFAFAITLLVLKIDIPVLTGELAPIHLKEELFELWPQYFSNIMSFFIIGNYWLVHHRLFNAIKQYDMGLVWLNMLFLMLITFIPFATDLIGEYPKVQIAALFYFGTLVLVGVSELLIWIYATWHHRLIDKHLSNSEIELGTLRALLPIVVFTVLIGVSFLNLHFAEYGWIVVFLLIPTLTHYWRKKYHKQSLS